MRRAASIVGADGGGGGDGETEHLSFLDLLCCGLGGAVLLFLVFVDFGSRPQPSVHAPPSLVFEVRWSGDKQVAVDLFGASSGNAIVPAAESTALDLEPVATAGGTALSTVVVYRLGQSVGAAAGPPHAGVQHARRATVTVSGERPDLEDIGLGLRFVSSHEMERRNLESDVEDLSVEVRRMGFSLDEGPPRTCVLPFGVRCVVRPRGGCSCDKSP